MKINIFHFAVSSLFNFAITNIIIAFMVMAILTGIRQAQKQVEMSMMETDVANIRWGLRELWAHRTASAQSVAADEIENANPLRLINERPENYLGEHSSTPQNAEAVWFFDTTGKRLVYVFRDGHQARYRLTGTPNPNRASLGAIGGIDLVLE